MTVRKIVFCVALSLCSTVTLAQSLGPRIRVNAVAPGPTLRNARQSEAHFKRQQASTILGRGALPDTRSGSAHPNPWVVSPAAYLGSRQAAGSATVLTGFGQARSGASVV